VVFAKTGDAQAVRLKDHTVELHYVQELAGSVVDLYGLKILRDNNTFALASRARDLTEGRFGRALRAHGRKLMVSSLFCQSLARRASEPAVSHMWTKIASYRFVSGALALSGRRPMPTHELEQTRQMESLGDTAGGLAAALECIGLERATRPAITRSIEALRELKSKDYDCDLVMAKIDFLLSKQMLSDCYYYIGKMSVESLAGRHESFYTKYAKLVQLALDLTSDAAHTEKLRRSLFKAATAMLKV
jgi:hypothetical protein